MGTGIFLTGGTPAISGGETRTLSIYHVHTKESLTITYMKDGKYIPSAMKKLNYILRDWRRNEVITISPKTIDLMWELHADLGSKRPIHIVSGYRSPKTNAFLKKIGRNVARKSQHMVGKAIDIYFPDVPTEKMRNSALVRQVGGVGYYRSGGGPTGFLHIDSGRVRHWGPAISSSQMAKIMRDYRKTVGARLGKKGKDQLAVPDTEVAMADATAAGLPSQQDGPAEKLKAKKKIPLETAYTEDDEELAGMSEDASAAGEKTKPKASEAPQPELVAEVPEGVTKSYPAPKPRPKPLEVLMLAAMDMKVPAVTIQPASAPPPTQIQRVKASPVEDTSIGTVAGAESLNDVGTISEGKTSLAAALRDGDAEGVPMLKVMQASVSEDELFWWPHQMVFDTASAERRNGAPQEFAETVATLLPSIGTDAMSAEAVPQMPRLAVADVAETVSAPGKGDVQVINQAGKGNLMMDAPALVQKRQKVGWLQNN